MTLFRTTGTVLAVSLSLLLAACGEGDQDQAANDSQPAQERQTADEQPAIQQQPEISLVNIVPGGGKPVDQQSAAAKKYENDPQAIAEGRQLFLSFNCVGCHSNGGGGMGPPLMDSKWIYGSSMENIASSIREGRPNGMPSFRAYVQGDTVYKLAAYVKNIDKNEATAKVRNEGESKTQ